MAVVALAAVPACSGEDGATAASPPTTPDLQPAPEALVAAVEADGGGAACDPLDPRACVLPFPSDRFTVADDETDTGRRVALPEDGLPANADGVVMDPTEWNRNDGWSPGTALLVHTEGLDPAASGLPPITDVPASLAADSPVVVVDTVTGERHPVWAELDSAAETPADELLFVRPGTNFLEGHRYVVGLRGLVDGDGRLLDPSPAFRAHRDGLTTGLPEVEDRRDAMERVFADLAAAGVARHDLWMAWDFTIASGRNLSERLLAMRDDAFAALGGEAPAFTVTDEERDPDGPGVTYVHGTFAVPQYLTGAGEPGSRLTQGPDGLPERRGTYTAAFECAVPDAAADTPAAMSLYGHGLLGSRGEVEAGNVADVAVEHDVAFCATDWIGMAEEDVGNAAAILGELGSFPSLADRGQQGILNVLFLGRLMRHEDGLASHPAFQAPDGAPLLDTSQLAFDANSQGGIMGGAATAVAQDWTRASLGVPGMNYSLLLRRSVDFDTYAAILDPAYPNPLDQALGLALVQMLWDRAENDGYAQHLTTDPYPDTPAHQVLLSVAFGDHQVTMWSAEIMARTIGAAVHRPALADGRHPDDEPYWGLPTAEEGTEGSVLVVWDSGAAVPPVTNTPPRAGPDPHEDPRADADNRRQKHAFLFDGRYEDVCAATPCTARPVTPLPPPVHPVLAAGSDAHPRVSATGTGWWARGSRRARREGSPDPAATCPPSYPSAGVSRPATSMSISRSRSSAPRTMPRVSRPSSPISARAVWRSSTVARGRPSAATRRSPSSTPPVAAGEPSSTSRTSRPSRSGRPTERRRARATWAGARPTPRRRGSAFSPAARRARRWRRASSAGTAR